jgi:ATP-dependent protease ClpP protease subunit
LTMEPNEKRVLTRILNEPHDIMMKLIKNIQASTGRKLILYVANFNHPLGAIHLLDVMPFEEVLRATNSENVDLMLNSPGGEINATEKLITMLRNRFKDIRVIVPNQAKSAATIMALASNKVVMGYLSELGPIDSQISVQNPDGTVTQIPAQSIIDSIDLLTEKIEKAKKDGCSIDHYVSMAYRIDPSLWDLALKAQKLTSQFAEKWLTQFMCKGNGERAKEITGKFMDVKRFLSHGRMISVRDAKEILPEDTVVELGKEDPLWDMIWELYVRSEWRLNTGQAVKLFGNETGILSIGAVGPAPPSSRTPRQPSQSPPQPVPQSSPQTREPSPPPQ